MSDVSTPISFPIKDLEYLESESYYRSFHYEFNKASVPLPSHAVTLPSRPRLLVCHDMDGGYRDDKWIQGGRNPSAFSIWHWYLMDVFVYFSHNTVTIPPPCWVNAAHRHGVKVLGTFITEWDAGRIVANKLLLTKESSQMYANLLTKLAVALGFDGWLINMEVKLEKSQIPNMMEFVKNLTQTMHSSLPGSLVIWYDSVTKDGDLNWQDQLNGKNKPFFDLCDGIFVNYTWKANYPKYSADVADNRKFDVYMGIDVFGRGTYGGGKWNVSRALDILKKDNVSAAVFAPGWVLETNQPPNFQDAQNKWWSFIWKSWGICQRYPKELPFYSNFDQGHGYHFSVEGMQVGDNPWDNTSCQHFQPIVTDFTDRATPIVVFIDSREKSYSGGGKLTCSGTLDTSSIFKTRIFEGELYLGILPIHISYSVNSLNWSCCVGLCFLLSNIDGEEMSVLVAYGFQNTFTSNIFDEIIVPSENIAEQGWIVHEADITKNGYKLTEIQVVCYTKGEPSDGNSIPFEASLGHVSIRSSEQDVEFPSASLWSTDYQNLMWSSNPNGSKTLSVKLIWKLKDGENQLFKMFNIFVKQFGMKTSNNPNTVNGDCKKFIGIANVGMFYVSELEIPGSITSLRFVIQVCRLDGACQKLDDSPALQLIVVP